ncbi:MAG: flagellar motor protein MotB [Pseudomonadota bacterium]
MSVSGENAAPVIIKRKKVSGGGGHHGGAWKVAYADFVTAMMAFFLLMWLLNATTEQQRKGIADYFSPMIPLNRVSGGGDGAFGGESVFSEKNLPENGTGGIDRMPSEKTPPIGATGIGTDGQETLAPEQFRSAGPLRDTTPATNADAEAQAQEATALVARVDDMLAGITGESLTAEEARRHVVARASDEGVVIELFDLDGSELFEEGTATPTRLLEQLAEIVALALEDADNALAVEGFVKSVPIVVRDSMVWELSVQRAAVMRQLLEQAGTQAVRFQRVTGNADREPATENRMETRNNRVEVVLLHENNP